MARLGGDEFVILADGLGRADAADLAYGLRNEIVQPIRAEGRPSGWAPASASDGRLAA
ncbi:hypothetical protein Sdagh_54150 [Streptomyces daghestanicus]|uniref:GGDEF domain-containing protein n=1 Tax=Streptomyces daghestanicus TaxID=66885 RepID=A0ABQ3Q8V0_9ACTN|nr:hypothetical protein Sdagh_54150 [Streptomyces daghestanicus]